MGRRKKNDYSESFRSIKNIEDKGYTISKNLLSGSNLDYFKELLKYYRFLDFENVLLFLSDFPEVLVFLVDFHPIIRKYFSTEELVVFYYEDYTNNRYDIWISVTLDMKKDLNSLRIEKLNEKFNSIANEDIESHVSLTFTPPL